MEGDKTTGASAEGIAEVGTTTEAWEGDTTDTPKEGSITDTSNKDDGTEDSAMEISTPECYNKV